MLENKKQKERESIWSIGRETKGLYFIVFIALVLVGAGPVTYEEVHVIKADGMLDTALAVWSGVERLIIPSVVGALIVTEAWRNGLVLAERLEEWFNKRREKQIAEAVEKAQSETEERTRAEVMALWQAWNERRVEAERQGQTFDEPPPSIKRPRPRIVDL